MQIWNQKTELFTWLAAIVIATEALFGTSSRAAEGFSTLTKDAPPAVQSAWSKTFAILTDYPTRYEIGTAFLVGKKKSDLYFLTVSHVVDSSCVAGKTCPRTYLVEDMRMRQDGKTLSLESTSGIQFRDVEVIDRSANPDLALLRVSTTADSGHLPEPIPLPSDCTLKVGEPFFSIGFPSSPDRTDPASLPISEKDIITKRWSRGVYVDLFHLGEGTEMKLFVGTTTDALEGNSGGPILNTSGEAVSVAMKSASGPENQFKYSGNEDPKSLDWQTLGARCEYLRTLKERLQTNNK